MLDKRIDPWNPPVNWDVFEPFDAVSDGPFYVFWRKIYAYHKCKCILTVREANGWFRSMMQHIYATNGGDAMTNTLLFGAGYPRPEPWKEKFLHHNCEVMAGIPREDLLVIDIDKGMSWEPLCKFLDKPVPVDVAPFPHIG